MKKSITIAILILSFACPEVSGQDQNVTVTNYNATLAKNRPWAQFNQVYIFRPIAPQISLYIFIRNNNTTNAHTLTLNVYQTPDVTVTDWTNNQGRWVTDTVQNVATCQTVAANTTSACYVVTMFAAKIAIRITAAVGAAGSPDNGDVYIIQAVGEPKGQAAGSGSQLIAMEDVDGNIRVPVITNAGNFITGTTSSAADGTGNTLEALLNLNAGSLGRLGVLNYAFNGSTWDRIRGNDEHGLAISSPFLFHSQRTGTAAGIAEATTNNPGAGTDLLNVIWNNGIPTLDSITISTDVAGRIEVHLTSAAPATCTTVTVRSARVNGPAPTAIDVTTACTTDPTSLDTIYTLFLSASSTAYIPLDGFILTGAGQGITVRNPSALTGNVSVTVRFYAP